MRSSIRKSVKSMDPSSVSIGQCRALTCERIKHTLTLTFTSIKCAQASVSSKKKVLRHPYDWGHQELWAPFRKGWTHDGLVYIAFYQPSSAALFPAQLCHVYHCNRKVARMLPNRCCVDMFFCCVDMYWSSCDDPTSYDI